MRSYFVCRSTGGADAVGQLGHGELPGGRQLGDGPRAAVGEQDGQRHLVGTPAGGGHAGDPRGVDDALAGLQPGRLLGALARDVVDADHVTGGEGLPGPLRGRQHDTDQLGAARDDAADPEHGGVDEGPLGDAGGGVGADVRPEPGGLHDRRTVTGDARDREVLGGDLVARADVVPGHEHVDAAAAAVGHQRAAEGAGEHEQDRQRRERRPAVPRWHGQPAPRRRCWLSRRHRHGLLPCPRRRSWSSITAVSGPALHATCERVPVAPGRRGRPAR